MTTFFTIGHSTHPIGEFIAILVTERIKMVVDVRTIPRSRTNPQFNADTFPIILAQHGIEYVHLAELGGLRGRQPSAKSSSNTFWHNDSFRNYADYALSDGFQAGLLRLERLGELKRRVIMCAEAVWWRCHRRIITDYLLFAGATVTHIMGQGKTTTARPTSAAHMRSDRRVIYPDPGEETVGTGAAAEALHRQIERWVNEGGAGGEDNFRLVSEEAANNHGTEQEVS